MPWVSRATPASTKGACPYSRLFEPRKRLSGGVPLSRFPAYDSFATRRSGCVHQSATRVLHHHEYYSASIPRRGHWTRWRASLHTCRCLASVSNSRHGRFRGPSLSWTSNGATGSSPTTKSGCGETRIFANSARCLECRLAAGLPSPLPSALTWQGAQTFVL